MQIIQRGEEYNRAIRGFRIGLEALTHLITVHFRHHDIKQNDFRLMALSKIQCFLALIGNKKPIALVFQCLVEHFQVLWIVIHEQNRHL